MTTAFEIASTADLTVADTTILEQIQAIRTHYRKTTGRRLAPLEAIRCLDQIRATWRAENAERRNAFTLCCPFCFGGEEDIAIDLNNLEAAYCFRCMESFTPQKAHDEIAETLEPWAELLRWIATAEAIRAARRAAVAAPTNGSACACHA